MANGANERWADRVPEIIEMREAGKTFQEIGERYGVSRQWIQILLSRAAATYVTSDAAFINEIVYDGIYRLFANDRTMTFAKFGRILFGYYMNHAEYERIRRWLTGGKDTCLTIAQIKRLCDYIGEPFESVFTLR